MLASERARTSRPLEQVGSLVDAEESPVGMTLRQPDRDQAVSATGVEHADRLPVRVLAENVVDQSQAKATRWGHQRQTLLQHRDDLGKRVDRRIIADRPASMGAG